MNRVTCKPWLLLLTALAGAVILFRVAPPATAQQVGSGEAAYWVEPMRQVHARFTGNRGTFLHFGDSLTTSMAFWARLSSGPLNMSPELKRDHALVSGYMKAECWASWKGDAFGNGFPSVGSLLENNLLEGFLYVYKPEVVLIMFGTWDLPHMDVVEYEQRLRQLCERCLSTGTVVILSTIPPRSSRSTNPPVPDMLDRSSQCAEAARRVARELKVPLVDFFGEVLKRRPLDWDGTLDRFKGFGEDGYQVPTLISGDGIHPSNPQNFDDYSERSLNNNGYLLRSVLTLQVYADVVRQVIRPSWFDLPGLGRWVKQLLLVGGVLGIAFVAVFAIRYRLLKAVAERRL
jgi:lysophospholipase L1-like esterase